MAPVSCLSVVKNISQKVGLTVVTVSDFNERHLRGLEIGGDLNVVRIYNGLDLEEFEFHSPLERAPLVVAVGRLVEKKGFGDLIEACALLSRGGFEYRCRIVGGGALESELRARIEELGLQERVSMTGPLPQGESSKLHRYLNTFLVGFPDLLAGRFALENQS